MNTVCIITGCLNTNFFAPNKKPATATPTVTGDLGLVFWAVTFKRAGLKFWAEFMQKYGSRWRIG
ncbi:DUF935 family protein [Kingella kingae]|uniref:phage portal protein family protein n=1 Tax=Kingella kingae TaxID=504 RepID=UPI0039AF6D80